MRHSPPIFPPFKSFYNPLCLESCNILHHFTPLFDAHHHAICVKQVHLLMSFYSTFCLYSCNAFILSTLQTSRKTRLFTANRPFVFNRPISQRLFVKKITPFISSHKKLRIAVYLISLNIVYLAIV